MPIRVSFSVVVAGSCEENESVFIEDGVVDGHFAREIEGRRQGLLSEWKGGSLPLTARV